MTKGCQTNYPATCYSVVIFLYVSRFVNNSFLECWKLDEAWPFSVKGLKSMYYNSIPNDYHKLPSVNEQSALSMKKNHEIF